MFTTAIHLVDSRLGDIKSRFDLPYRIHATMRYALVALYGGNEAMQLAALLYDVAGFNRMGQFSFEDKKLDVEVKDILTRCRATNCHALWNEWSFNTVMDAEECDQTIALVNLAFVLERVTNECRFYYTRISKRDEVYGLVHFTDDLIRALKENPRTNGKKPEIIKYRTRTAIIELTLWSNRLNSVSRADVMK